MDSLPTPNGVCRTSNNTRDVGSESLSSVISSSADYCEEVWIIVGVGRELGEIMV